MPHTSASDFGFVNIKQPSLIEINELNRKFWEKQNRLFGTDTVDEVVFQQVEQDLGSERADIPSSLPTHQGDRAVGKASAEYLTPEQYLKTHHVARELAHLGVTNEQLQGLRFLRTNKGLPFDQWSFTWFRTEPYEAISLARAYCALKWLILENPPYSRDKQDAWRYVTETMAAPTFAIGEKTRNAQSTRAKKPRGRLPEGGKTINQEIEERALKPQYRGETAKELWPCLWAFLSEKGLNPEEIVDRQSPEKWSYMYDFKRGRKRISFRRFEGVVSNARRKKKSH